MMATKPPSIPDPTSSAATPAATGTATATATVATATPAVAAAASPATASTTTPPAATVVDDKKDDAGVDEVAAALKELYGDDDNDAMPPVQTIDVQSSSTDTKKTSYIARAEEQQWWAADITGHRLLEPTYYTPYTNNNQLLTAHNSSLLSSRYSLPLWDVVNDNTSLSSQLLRMASQTSVSQKYTQTLPSLFVHRVSQGVVRERAMTWRKQHAIHGPSVSYWRIRRVLEAKERADALAKLNGLAPTDQIAVRLAIDVLTDSDLSPRHVKRLLDILSDVLKQSPTLTGSTDVALAVERVLLRLLSASSGSSSASATSDGTDAKSFMGAIVSMVVARQSLGALLQLIERVLLTPSAAGSTSAVEALQASLVPVLPLTALANARGKFGDASTISGGAKIGGAAGGVASAADGALFSWGINKYGALGVGDEASRTLPVPVKLSSTDASLKTSKVFSFGSHAAAIGSDNKIYVWGNGGGTRLGKTACKNESVPRQITFSGSIVTQIACGSSFTLWLADSKAWFVGRGYYESSGIQSIETITTAKSLPITGTVKMIAAGAWHCLAATTVNKVYAWGRNTKGACGVGHTKTCDNQSPELVATLNDKPLAQLSCGWLSSTAVTATGEVFTWGGSKTDIPVCGHDDGQPRLTPKLVDDLKGKVIVSVAQGWDHTLAITNKGEIYSWGDGTYGKLGHGTTGSEATPRKLELGSEAGVDVRAFMVAAGPSQSACISRDGKLYLWGSFATSAAATVSFDKPTIVKSFSEPVKHVALGWNATYVVMGTPDLSTFAAGTVESKKDKESKLQATPKKPSAQSSAPASSPSLSSATASSTGAKDGKDNKDNKDNKDDKDSKDDKSAGGDSKGESKDPIVTSPEEPPLPLFAPGGVLRRSDMKIASDATNITARHASLAILSHIDRLCSEHKSTPTILSSRVDGDASLLSEPFCIDVTRATMGRLQNMLTAAIARVVEKKESDDTRYWSDSFIVLSLLRILKTQFQRLIASGVPPQSLAISLPGVTLPLVEEIKEKSADQRTVEDSDTFSVNVDLIALRDVLLSIVRNDGVIAAVALHSEAKPLIVSEAQSLLVSSLEVFYPTVDSRIALIKSLLSDDKYPARNALLARLAENQNVAMLIPAPIRPKLHIAVINARGDKLFVVLPATDATVGQLKSEVEHYWQFPVSRQRICYGGSEWTDGQSLLSAGIKEGAIVKLFVKGDAVLSGVASSSTAATNQPIDPSIKATFFKPCSDYGGVYAEEVATSTAPIVAATPVAVASSTTAAGVTSPVTPAAAKKAARGGRGGARGGRGGARGGAVSASSSTSSSSSSSAASTPTAAAVVPLPTNLTSTLSNAVEEVEEKFVAPSETSDETGKRLKDLEAAALVAKQRNDDNDKRYHARVLALQDLLAVTLSACVGESKSKEPTAGEKQSTTPVLALLVALTKQTIAWTLHVTGTLETKESKAAAASSETVSKLAIATLQQHITGVVTAAVPFAAQVLSMATAPSSPSPSYGLGCIEMIRMGFIGALSPSLMIAATSLVSYGITTSLIKPLLELETTFDKLVTEWQSLSTAATASGAAGPPVLMRALSIPAAAAPLSIASSMIEERDEPTDAPKAGAAIGGSTDDGNDDALVFDTDPTPVIIAQTAAPIAADGDSNISIPPTLALSGLSFTPDTDGIDRVHTQTSVAAVPLDDAPEDDKAKKKGKDTKDNKGNKNKKGGKASKGSKKSKSSGGKKDKSKKDKKDKKDSDGKKDAKKSDSKTETKSDAKSDEKKTTGDTKDEKKSSGAVTSGWVYQLTMVTRHVTLATLSDVASRVSSSTSAADRIAAITSLQTFLAAALSSSNDGTITLVLHHIARAFADRSILSGLEQANDNDRQGVLTAFTSLIETVVSIITNNDQQPSLRLLALAACVFRVTAAERTIITKAGLLSALHAVLAGGLLSGKSVAEQNGSRTNKCPTPSCACNAFKFASAKPTLCLDCNHTHAPPPRVIVTKAKKPGLLRPASLALVPSASSEAMSLMNMFNDDAAPVPAPATPTPVSLSSSTSASSVSVSLSSISSTAAAAATPVPPAPLLSDNKDPDDEDSESSDDQSDEDDDDSSDGSSGNKAPKWAATDLRERVQLEAAAWKVLQWLAGQLGVTAPLPTAALSSSTPSSATTNNDEMRAIVAILSSELERTLAASAVQTVDPAPSPMYSIDSASKLLRTAGDVALSLWFYAQSVPSGEAENIISLTGSFPSKYSAMGRDCIRVVSIDWAKPDAGGFTNDGGGIMNVRVSGLNDNLSFYTKSLPPRKWVHIGVSVKKDVVTVYVNGVVSTSGQCYSPRILPEIKPTLKMASPTSINGLQVILSPYIVMDKHGQANWISSSQPEVRFTEQYASQIVALLSRVATNGNASLIEPKLLKSLFGLLDTPSSTGTAGAGANAPGALSLTRAPSAPKASPIAETIDDPTIHPHPIVFTLNLGTHLCDVCRADISSAHRCAQCDFDYCSNCLRAGKKPKKSGGDDDGSDDDEEEEITDDEHDDEKDDIEAAIAASIAEAQKAAAAAGATATAAATSDSKDGKTDATTPAPPAAEPVGPRAPVSGLLRAHVLRLCRALFTTLSPSQAASLFLTSSAASSSSAVAAPTTLASSTSAAVSTTATTSTSSDSKEAASTVVTVSKLPPSTSSSSPIIDWLFGFITRELILTRIGQPSVVSDAIGVARSLLCVTQTSNEWYTLVYGYIARLLANPQDFLVELHRASESGKAHKLILTTPSSGNINGNIVSHTLAAIYIVAGNVLTNTSFFDDGIAGVMGVTSPTDDAYAVYYRISSFLTTLSNLSLAKPDLTKKVEVTPPASSSSSSSAIDSAATAATAATPAKPARVRCSLAASAGQVATPGCTITALVTCNDCNASYCDKCDIAHHAIAANSQHKKRVPHEQLLLVFMEQMAELKEQLAKKDAELNEARGITSAAIPTAPPLSTSSTTTTSSSTKKDDKKDDKKSLWSPLVELATLIDNIKDVLQLYGAVAIDGSLPCDRASFKLHNVASIAGVAPRSQIGKPKRVKISEAKKSSSSSSAVAAVWASGTGYGHGSEESSSSWDPNSTRAAQDRKDRTIAASLDDVVRELNGAVLPTGFATALEQSAVIPVLEQYLANDSLSELEKSPVIYNTIFAVLQAMLKHVDTAKLFNALPGQRASLQSLLANLADQARIVVKLGRMGGGAGGAAAKPKADIPNCAQCSNKVSIVCDTKDCVGHGNGLCDTHDASHHALPANAAHSRWPRLPASLTNSKDESSVSNTLANRIVDLSSGVTRRLAGIAVALAIPAASSSDSKDEKSSGNDWISLMKNERFAELKEFKFHHFSKEGKVAPTRTYMRRLQSEFADLYKCLPLHPDSSIFVRVQEGNMSHAQMLVTAPVDTPYARGAFLFDVYFPADYPNIPPKLNLQTTGGNTFRFNPNLYQNGNVCLSLLGTWQGSADEKWKPGVSTFLQVCVSVQSLIFVANPYFNEPGYEKQGASAMETSNDYNSNVRNATLSFAMIDMIKNPPPGFEYPVLAHFYMNRDAIIKQVEAWTQDGVSKADKLTVLKSHLTELKTLLAKLEMPKPPVRDDD